MKHTFITIILALFVTVAAWSGAGSDSVATHDAYFDVATGYKYIKNSDHTYAEYSKKGKLLRQNVPNDLPLLVSGKYIREMILGTFFIYEKRGENAVEQQILSASDQHPKGWRCEGMLVSSKHMATLRDAGLGYTQGPTSILYDGKKLMAVGDAYYDTATHHKYVRNPDDTYTEYSKKGKLLRSNVPNHLPLLTSGRYIYDLKPGDFMVYEKREKGKRRQQILPATQVHPAGWYAQGSLTAIK